MAPRTSAGVLPSQQSELHVDTYLFIKFDEGGFVEFLRVLANVAYILSMTETLVSLGLFVHEVPFDCSGKRVQWNLDIFGISDLLELNVGDFLVIHDCGIVGWHVAWKFGEV